MIAIPPELRIEMQSLGDVANSGLLCPACEGGRSKERSLTMWRDGLLVKMKCWRASCGYYYSFGSPLQSPTREKAAFAPRPFCGELSPLTGELRHILTSYRIRKATARTWGLKSVIGGEAQLCMPVYGPYGTERGAVIRRWDRQPKAMSYKLLDQPWQAWYTHPGRQSLVIVEDQLSAMRVWQMGMSGVALLGTSLSDEKVEEVKAWRIPGSVVHLALDRDAFKKACRLASLYASQLPMKVVLLDKDIKDSVNDEIKERIFGRRADSRSDTQRQAGA